MGQYEIIVFSFPLLIGWLMDLSFGDPNSNLHPIVLFGKSISYGERILNKTPSQKCNGALLSLFLIVVVFFFFSIIGSLLIHTSTYLFLVYATLAIYFFLAGKTLRKEVREVFLALDDSLEHGRKQVARIVGRDTTELNEQEIRKAALETLAENLSDGVVAPLFWYLLLGIPGIATYKMINTLDSMIAYKTTRYKEFGHLAAKIDDIANYIPARLTAFLMLLVSGQINKIKLVFQNGKRHISPNSGYPEAALAYIINCQFGGAHIYHGELIKKPLIGQNNRELTTADMQKALNINFKVEVLSIALSILIYLIAISL